MVEHTRAHRRLEQSMPAGRRERLSIGALFIPAPLQLAPKTPLLVHFHGAPWLSEVAVDAAGSTAVISVQLGNGSSAYAKPFADRMAFEKMIREAEELAGVQFEPITVSAWSAGYGAVREVLNQPQNYSRVQSIILLDALHTGYVGGKPGPQESQLEPDPLEPFVRFARDAASGKKRLLVTHTEIFPGTFASTTETADYLIRELGLRRTPVLKWGPLGTQQLSEVNQGNLTILGFAGNSAPDHVDQLHALSEFLKLVRGR
jgi:hypothetical protein